MGQDRKELMRERDELAKKRGETSEELEEVQKELAASQAEGERLKGEIEKLGKELAASQAEAASLNQSRENADAVKAVDHDASTEGYLSGTVQTEDTQRVEAPISAGAVPVKRVNSANDEDEAGSNDGTTRKGHSRH
eukprot:3264550-Rhodomonas_salina.1